MLLKTQPRSWISRWAGVLAVCLALVPARLEAVPQPLSQAEIAAVRLASMYLEEGPASWWSELAPGSELAALGEAAALAEIEARAGSPIGAHWTLQLAGSVSQDPPRAVFTIGFPSGIEEILALSFERRPEGFLLSHLHTSAEPQPGRANEPIAGVEPTPVDGGPAATAEAPAVDANGLPPTLSIVAVAVGAVFLGLAFAARRRVPVALAAAVLALASIGWGVYGWFVPATEKGVEVAAEPVIEPVAEPSFLRLGALVGLRQALTQPDPSALAAELEKLTKGSPEERIARLWHGQYLLAEQDLNAVQELLKEYPPTRPVAQAELLRARLAFLRFEEVEAAAAYERAFEAGAGYDDVLFEAAQILEFLGFDERTDDLYRRLEEMGSRNPELYYRLAGRALVDGWNARASQYFAQGWQLNPLERDEVLSRPLLAAQVQDFSVKALLRMDEIEEPGVLCAKTGPPPFEFPAGASTRVIGSLFVAEFFDGELWVPNGCELASPSTASFDPESWRKRNDTLALAELPTLIESTRTKGVVALPRLRDRVAEAAEALARRRRWDDLLALTEGIDRDLPRLPASLARLRARALKETGRIDEARELLTKLAAINIRKRRPDPGTLMQLADLMVTNGEYDVAVRLIEKADAAIPADVGFERIQQIYMEKQLASAYTVHSTEHFEIRFPARHNPYLAERIGEILEAERKRLGKWITPAGGRTEVHLLPWGDFRTAWSTSVEILGLYDGKIRLPFAEVRTFNPLVVSVMTHELAHAMIDSHTRQKAPHWLHEGLAQHVQMVQGRINPIGGYAAKKNLLTFPLIESVLVSFAAPAMVGVAYDEALWTVHYIESVHGRRSIRRLLDAFRDGMDTEEAIRSVFGMSMAEFDRDLWDWCIRRAPAAWKGEVVRYDRG